VPENCERTPGWDTPSGPAPALGKTFSARSVGHNGFTGTAFWIDPEHEVVVTLLTNRVHPTRENPRMQPFRGRFHEALAKDLFGIGSSASRDPLTSP
jgi:CubicO group peptidase (beta-lactamase class C family)